MDETYLLGLAVAVIVGLAAVGAILARRQRQDELAHDEGGSLAVSTEGMKVCPSCGMGNLWTETRCISCGSALKG